MINTFLKNAQSLLKSQSLLSTRYARFCANSDSHHNSCADYQKLLEGNDLYVRQRNFSDPTYFERLAQGQSPKYLFIGCSDSRVPPNDLTQTGPGELFIHRNVANLVSPTDFNLNAVLEFAIHAIKVKHIIVMGHTRCGGVKAATEDKHHGMIDQWLAPIREVNHRYQEELSKIQDEEQRLRRLTELNIKEQVLNLCKNQFVQKAWAAGLQLEVHGWICEIETGRIIDLNVQQKEWKNMENFFKLKFPM
eukprot:CAMPEP_0176416456 /NCGR_PEP_ID=MMETSP0127-20121128/6356_1 /TAXON_ID=938130 /ORGANISM="Platyophrya macrostoma, Strain WH" /LENGTH=248 /DNA_ID=CAMNT_0017796533 /DNA_START=28 /DNA_END=774 /DNA_ORIENTATION=+